MTSETETPDADAVPCVNLRAIPAAPSGVVVRRYVIPDFMVAALLECPPDRYAERIELNTFDAMRLSAFVEEATAGSLYGRWVVPEQDSVFQVMNDVNDYGCPTCVVYRVIEQPVDAQSEIVR